MYDPSWLQVLLKNPLQDSTKKEKHYLLGLSALGVLFVKGALLPTQISALGIVIGPMEKTWVLASLFVLILYLIIAFTIHAIADFLLWRDSIKEKQLTIIQMIKSPEEEKRKFLKMGLPSHWAKPVSIAQAAFEIILPVCIGLIGTIVLACNI